MKRLLIITLVELALLFGACLFLLLSCTEKKTDETTKSYETLTFSPGSKSLTSRYTATLQGRQDVEIRPQVSGTITQVCAAEGEPVSKGQTLFIIDQVPYEAALKTAEAQVKVARADVSTSKLTAESKDELYRKNIISALEKQTADNTLQSQLASLALAEAQETNARNNLSYTVVKSPVDGTAGMIPYRVGALVGPDISTPLTTVSDNSEVYAYFSMTEAQILSLSRQSGSIRKALDEMPAVRLLLSDGSEYAYPGKIDAVSGVIDATTGAVSLRATFPNAEGVILSGGSATIIFPYERESCIVIPQSATYEVQDKVYAYKVVDGCAVATLINVSATSDGKDYIVEEGLKAGDVIVTEGVSTLKEGTAIQPKETNTNV